MICGLITASLIVDVEYYDGFDSICNARWYLGLTASYVPTRAPLMGLLLVPAEWARGALGLHPMDVRAPHCTTALLHAIYLIGVYGLLRRVHGSTPACLISFVAAVPCFMFVSYAPFVSHDIIGGGLFLGMVYVTERCRTDPGPGPWLCLVLLGTASMLLHHRFIASWLILIGVSVGLALRSREGAANLATRLLSAMAAGGAVFWLWTGWAMGSLIPDTPLLIRPVRQAVYILSDSKGAEYVAPIWVFVRNLPAYGTLTIALLAPGLVMSLRGTRLQRTVGWAWICGFCFAHLTGIREVRFLLYLTPLSAFLIVPSVAWLIRTRRGCAAVLLLWLISFVPGFSYSVTSEALRICQPFYRRSQLRELLEPLSVEPQPRLVANTHMLSSTPPDDSPLAGDRYHRLFHLGIHQVGLLFGYQLTQIRQLRKNEQPIRWPDDTVIIWCSHQPLVNAQTWRTAPPNRLGTLRQVLLVSRSVAVHAVPRDSHVTRDGRPIILHLRVAEDDEHVLSLSGDGLDQYLDQPYALIVELPGQLEYRRTLPAVRAESNRFELTGLDTIPPLTPENPMRIHGWVVLRRLDPGMRR